MNKIKNLLLSLVMVAGILGAGNLFASQAVNLGVTDFEIEDQGNFRATVTTHVAKGSTTFVVNLVSVTGEGDDEKTVGCVACVPYEGDAPEWNKWDSNFKFSMTDVEIKEENFKEGKFRAWVTAPKEGDAEVEILLTLDLKAALEADAQEEEKADAAVEVVKADAVVEADDEEVK